MNDEMVALIAEGSAEEAILTILIENNLLKFPRQKIYNEEVIRVRSAKSFQNNYLNQGLGSSKLVVYRVLDSKKEQFNLSKAYQRKVEQIIQLYTRPEIEILFIVYNGDFGTYTSKSHMKASDYVKQRYHDVKNPKSKDDVYTFWSRKPDELVKTIKEYARLTNDPYEETIASILK